jgi:hypothetical protein
VHFDILVCYGYLVVQDIEMLADQVQLVSCGMADFAVISASLVWYVLFAAQVKLLGD